MIGAVFSINTKRNVSKFFHMPVKTEPAGEISDNFEILLTVFV